MNSRTRSRIQRSGQPETDEVEPADRGAPVAASRTEARRIAEPGTAAKDARTSSQVRYGPAVRGSVRVTVLGAVGDPLPNVAMHVVQAKGICLERANGRSLLVPVTSAPIAICPVLADLVAPSVLTSAACPRRILPFRLG